MERDRERERDRESVRKREREDTNICGKVSNKSNDERKQLLSDQGR